MFDLQRVTKRYTGRTQVDALAGVDLLIGEGEFVAVQGPTGHGKTTLLQLMGGLDQQTDGVVRYEGVDLGTLSQRPLSDLRAHDFGFIFQSFNLIPTLTARENVETALVPLGVHAHARRERAREALASVGLEERVDHLPGELSGGEQQRAAIARALVKAPRVLFADEPTGNLDEGTRDEIIGLLESLWRERGVTLIIVTHDGQVAARAPRRIQLTDGAIVETQRRAEVT